MVKVPDSTRLKMAYIELGKEEMESEFDSAYTAIYVFNLINRSDYAFKDGIYVWNVMGPHFPRRLLIRKEGQTCIFKSTGAFEPTDVLEEYLKCIKELRLSDSNVRLYLKAISKYLDEEQGKTYGAEIIKE